MAITSLTQCRSTQIANGKEAFNLRSGEQGCLEDVIIKGMHVGCICVMLNEKWLSFRVFLTQLLYLFILQFYRVRITWCPAAIISRI